MRPIAGNYSDILLVHCTVHVVFLTPDNVYVSGVRRPNARGSGYGREQRRRAQRSGGAGADQGGTVAG